MKLSYRDKVIFIAAIVIIIVVAGIFLFIKPKFEEMNRAQAALQSKQAEKAEVEAKINTLPELVDQLKATAGEVEELQSYFLTEQDPYLNEQFIKEMLDESRLTVTSMETNYTVGSNITEYMVPAKNVHSYDLLIQGDLYNELPQEVYDDYNKLMAPAGAVIVIGVTEMSVQFSGDVSETQKLFDFVDKIAADERTITIPTFSADVNEAEGLEATAEGTIDITLYSLFPLNIEKIMEESDTVEIVPVEEVPAETTAAE